MWFMTTTVPKASTVLASIRRRRMANHFAMSRCIGAPNRTRGVHDSGRCRRAVFAGPDFPVGAGGGLRARDDRSHRLRQTVTASCDPSPAGSIRLSIQPIRITHRGLPGSWPRLTRLDSNDGFQTPGNGTMRDDVPTLIRTQRSAPK